ncbi:hypothetical protein [Falsigemmobacter faecalis]|uniref:Uncharacterized protein n=1 Tax=Falsigemmobacter faecalis TaxID=2488730 RepID=A0A3P3DCD5_9RHOB|nr:hypothetical protein [Falsigemmobacter faecalis]RRH71993.1 hypothetical protein EG244_15885 [Falsigemmobacter faecalis]
MAAGFDPDGFWQLTPRLFSALMRGARGRIELQIDLQNRLAWQTAALSGAAFVGKLPAFEKVFPEHGGREVQPQTPEHQEGFLRALAAAWGATAIEAA